MKKFKLLGLSTALAASLFLAACGANEKEQAAPKEETQSYTVTDDTGAEITFDKVPEKVISLQPSNTEILFALGQGEKVVGVTDFDNYPEEAKEIKRVSDSMNINAEEIIGLKPDAIIAYTIGDENTLKPLKDAGIPIFVIQSALTFEDVYGDIEQIAEVMGVEEKGAELITDIKEQIAAVGEKVATIENKEKVYFEISPAPEIYTTGTETFQQEILEHAGVENVFADQSGWIKVSDEEILKRNPNTIITNVTYVENAVEELKSRSGWNKLSAVKNNKVFLVDSDVMSRPGPRIGEAVELTAKTVYPDLFK